MSSTACTMYGKPSTKIERERDKKNGGKERERDRVLLFMILKQYPYDLIIFYKSNKSMKKRNENPRGYRN